MKIYSRLRSRWRRRTVSDRNYQLYQYEPLKNGYTRSLTLLAGHKDSEIRVKLEDVPIPASRQQSNYEALSYTWGSEENPAYVVVEGTQAKLLRVTRNLEEALLHLRSQDESRILWVDAACINQTDEVEKSRQVSQMSDIFENASRVVAWLGPADDDGDLAMNALKVISDSLLVDINSRIVTSHNDGSSFYWGDELPISLTSEQAWALVNLFHRSWFSRLWVWQEICLGGEHSVIVCGEQHLSWKNFRNAVALLWTRPDIAFPAGQELIHCLRNISELCLYDHFPLLAALQATRSCRCRDPRDKIYAVLGLSKIKAARSDIKADYTQTTRAVYTNTALTVINMSGAIDILLFGGQTNVVPNLPSWVPDWSVTLAVMPLVKHAAAGSRHLPSNGNSNSNILRVKGLCVCRIRGLVPYLLPDDEVETLSQREERVLLFLSQLCSEPLRSIGNETLAGICRVLTFTDFNEDIGRPLFQQCLSVLTELCSYGHSESSLRDAVYTTINNYCRGRAFFTSEDGKHGLVRSEALPGDIIIVALGCPAALTLRSVDDGQYTLIGDAYCDGVMKGEMLLGPLPDRFEISYNRNGSRHSRIPIDCFYFHDLQTGNVSLEDPRLPPLPPDWQRVDVSDGLFPEYRHIETAEIRDPFNDPRFAPEYLEKQGLKLCDFEII